MPRVSREQTDINRGAIMSASARLFRERGIKGVSVADLMAAAGLTHGGFYGHFDSKEALAAEACRLAFAQSIERWSQRVAEKGDKASARASLVEPYLSAKARANPGTSCPATALAADVAREPIDAPIRAAYAAGLESLVDILSTVQGADGAAGNRDQALADLSMMAGALLLARATEGQSISDELLMAARRQLSAARRPPAARQSSRSVRV